MSTATFVARFAAAVIIFALSSAPALTAAADVAPRSRGGRGESVPQPPRAPVAQSVSAADAEPVELWFVELSSPPTAGGGRHADTQADKQRFRSAAAQAGLEFHERYAFDQLWNGLSIRIDTRSLGQLGRVPGVIGLYPVETLAPDPEPEGGVDLFNALSMTGADLAQDDLGFTGSGVRVGIIDTGVDYHHPALGGCFGTGCRVETGWDFVGDAFTGSLSTAVPDSDPDDPCRGHGTHVAGIVGADGEVRGVAPRVTFGAYRVFGCEGSTAADVMIAAMERALADDMDVINMSIGSGRQWPQYPTAAAADRLVNAGVVVVASFGNSGSQGLYAGGAPGVGKKVIGVASLQNDAVLLPSFEAEGRAVPYDTMTFAPDPPQIGSEQIIYIGRACDTDPLLANPAGKIALAERGECFFRDKAMNAFSAGATALVVHNNRFGMVFGTVLTPPLTRPVVGITQTDGLYLRGLEGPLEITWTSDTAPAKIAGGGLINSFSSFGLSPDLLLKPDLAAPGGSIYSTYPLERDGYATLSGTSMAAPHVAGAAALLLEARPHMPAQAVRAILQNSADPVPFGADPAPDAPEVVHRQGAGMVDVDDAILAVARITPAKLSLGEVAGFPVVHSLEIESSAADPMTFDLSHEPALSTSGVIVPSRSTAAARVSFATPFVTLPPGGTGSVGVSIEAPSGLSFGQFGGYVVFSPRDGGPELRVPYAGFAGDYQAVPALTPSIFGWPWLAVRAPSGAYQDRPFGETFSLEGDDVPWIVFHLDHQVRKLRMEIFDAASGRAWHRAHELEYFPRNSSTTSFWSLAWDGKTIHGNHVSEVPDGSYRVRLSVQKALGDDDDPRHWNSWTSPIVTIARPAAKAPGREEADRDAPGRHDAAPVIPGR